MEGKCKGSKTGLEGVRRGTCRETARIAFIYMDWTKMNKDTGTEEGRMGLWRRHWNEEPTISKAPQEPAASVRGLWVASLEVHGDRSAVEFAALELFGVDRFTIGVDSVAAISVISENVAARQTVHAGGSKIAKGVL